MNYLDKYTGQSKKGYQNRSYTAEVLAVVILIILFFKDKITSCLCPCDTSFSPGSITHPDYDLKGSVENVSIDVEDFERSQDEDVTMMQPSQLSQIYFPSTDTLMLSINN